MKLDAGSGHHKAIYCIAWPGKPQAATHDFQFETFRCIDQAFGLSVVLVAVYAYSGERDR